MLDCIMNKGDKYTPELIGRNGEIINSGYPNFFTAIFPGVSSEIFEFVDNHFYDKKSPRIKIIIKGMSYDYHGKKYCFFSIDPNQDFSKVDIYLVRTVDIAKREKSDLINQVFFIDMKYVNVI